MTRREQFRNATLSYLRVFAAAALAVYLASGKAPSALTLDDLRHLLDAGVAAALLTAANALRPGETTFGRGAVPADDEGLTAIEAVIITTLVLVALLLLGIYPR